MVDSANAGFDFYDDTEDNDRRLNGVADASDYIVDIREYDVPYHVRVAIDRGEYSVRLRVILWSSLLQIFALGNGIR